MTNVLDHILALARQQHVLTFDQILAYIPQPESDVVVLDELFLRCMEEKIDVLEDAPPDSFDDEVVVDDAEELERVLQTEPGIDDPLRLYLREIGQISLINEREEKELAKQI